MNLKEKVWRQNLDSEVEFWNNWLSTKGSHWKDDYIYRLDPDSEVTGFFKDVLKTVDVDEDYKILDVGAGPITILGKKYNGIKLNITAVDALAEIFNKLNWQDVVREVITKQCETEKLHEMFGEGEFDLVHARNTLDHHYDVLAAFKSMLHVTRPGGLVIASHTENEGKNNHWEGLHKWNLFLEDGDMKIADQEGIYSLRDSISHLGKIIAIEKAEQNVINLIIQRN